MNQLQTSSKQNLLIFEMNKNLVVKHIQNKTLKLKFC